MAIDTAQKRYSMINFMKPTNFMLFQVDGSVDADDKYHLLHLYSGITLDTPSAVSLPKFEGFLVNVGRLMR